MQTYSIPVSERERYLKKNARTQSNAKLLTDSRGVSSGLWPITFDVPSDLLVHLENERLAWIELKYLTDHGEVVEHELKGLGSFSFFLYHGLLLAIKPKPMPTRSDAYNVVRTCIERLLEVTRFQSNLAPGKWKAIFSTQLLLEQWTEGEPFLRQLIATAPHPYR